MMVLINGKLADKISVHDRGFQFGDGLFETMKIVEGEAKDLAEHIARMQESCVRIGIDFPNDWPEEIKCSCNNYTKGVCKIIITRGESSFGLKTHEKQKPNRLIKITDLPRQITTLQQSGVKLQLCETRLSSNPATQGLKMLNWLEPVLAHLELKEGVYEGLMRDQAGSIVECTSSNFFGLKEGALITSDLLTCGLKGITRKQIIDKALALGMSIEERAIAPEELAEFEACFISNSVIGVYPVTHIATPNKEHSYAIASTINKLLATP